MENISNKILDMSNYVILLRNMTGGNDLSVVSVKMPCKTVTRNNEMNYTSAHQYFIGIEVIITCNES